MNKGNSVSSGNKVTIIGSVEKDPVYSHTILGEDFYKMNVICQRLSGCCDTIPVIVSGRIMEDRCKVAGRTVCVRGQFQSRGLRDGERRRLDLYVMAAEIGFLHGSALNPETNNQIFLNGYIGRIPTYRKTPLGKEIADFLLSVERLSGRLDRIPCIAWGRNARYAGGLPIWTRVMLRGRIQSRNYIKKLDNGTEEERTAFEVSVSSMELAEEYGNMEGEMEWL